MKKPRYIIIVLIVLILYGCYAPKSHIIDSTTIRYPILFDKNNNLMRTDGVYTREDYSSREGIGMYYFFFPDGTFHAVILLFPIFHGDTLNVSESLKKEYSITHDDCWKHSIWGVYHITGDTVIAEGFARWGLFSEVWTSRSFHFKVQERYSMTEYYGNTNYSDGSYDYDVTRNLAFIPTSDIPSSDKYNYVKKEKLMWSDKKAWKAYMQKMKIEKNRKE